MPAFKVPAAKDLDVSIHLAMIEGPRQHLSEARGVLPPYHPAGRGVDEEVEERVVGRRDRLAKVDLLGAARVELDQGARLIEEILVMAHWFAALT